MHVPDMTMTTDPALTTVTELSTVPVTSVPDHAGPYVWGFVAAVVSVLFFGSNFVPVKKFETGNGMFFQWVLCTAIWLSGLVVNCVRGFPAFQARAMLGGFLWATGNVCVVPIIKTIGLGKGILVWATFNMLSGWASGRFGWFGLDAEDVTRETLNYIGVVLCLLSSLVYIFIRTEVATSVSTPEVNPLLSESSEDVAINTPASTGPSVLEGLSATKRTIVGTILAVFSGLLYGLNFAPVIYLQDHGHSKNGLDYVFSHFSGIFVTSSVYFVVYAAVSCNQPRLYPRAILPGIASGLMWALADIAWFIANDALSEAVSFPIITAGPGVVAALWGVFFREIRGTRNLVVLGAAICVTITGTVLTGFSK